MRWFALLTPIVLSAAVCGGSNAQQLEATSTIAFTRGAAGQVWLMTPTAAGRER